MDIPRPLSLTSKTACPDCSHSRTPMVPPARLNLMALLSRFQGICSIRVASPSQLKTR